MSATHDAASALARHAGGADAAQVDTLVPRARIRVRHGLAGADRRGFGGRCADASKRRKSTSHKQQLDWSSPAFVDT